MATEDILKKLADALNKHDPQACASLYAPECVVHDPLYPEPLRGPDAVRRDFESFFRGFPDIQIQPVNPHANGDTAIAEATMRGTHKGPLDGPAGQIPPTNKRIDVRGAIFCRLNQQGLVVEERRYYDTGTMMQQLGLMPTPAQATTAGTTGGTQGQRRSS